jgi:hypothetical protein
MTGMKEIGPGVVVHAWMGWSFYLASWLSVCFMWAAVGFSIAGAFKVCLLIIFCSVVRELRARELLGDQHLVVVIL